MALSRVMASSSSATSDLTRQSSIYSRRSLGSVNIDDPLRNIESDGGGGGDASVPAISTQGSTVASNNVINDNTADEGSTEIDGGQMTLEAFLVRIGEGPVSGEEDVKVRTEGTSVPATVGAMCPWRGEMLDPVEKAALRRKLWLIKNLESAAVLRKRKQVYIAELESLVIHFKEENAQLVTHKEERERKRLKQEERERKRLKQLAESWIPITELRKTYCPLRRTRSMGW